MRQKNPASVTTIIRDFTDMIGITQKNILADCNGKRVVIGETLPMYMTRGVTRFIRTSLSLNDPTVHEKYKKMHQLYVCGCPLSEMRSQGCTMEHIISIGVSYDDWTIKAGYGLKEIAYMGGGWIHVVAMGFLPCHLKDREKNGPAILKAVPFCVSWRDLSSDLGLTIDEAIFDVGMTTSDFNMFGETMSSLIARGFGIKHRKHMKEADQNFIYALSASPEDLSLIDGTNRNRHSEKTVTANEKTVTTDSNLLKRPSNSRKFVY